MHKVCGRVVTFTVNLATWFLFATHHLIALSRILETVVTFHFSGGKVYSVNKGCHTCMIKHTMHVQSARCVYIRAKKPFSLL